MSIFRRKPNIHRTTDTLVKLHELHEKSERLPGGTAGRYLIIIEKVQNTIIHRGRL